MPAEDIDIYVHFPDGFRMYALKENETRYNYLQPPSAPPVPEPPQTFMQKQLRRANAQISIPDFRLPNIHANCSFGLKRTHSYDFTCSVKYLKHGLSSRETITDLLLVFEDRCEVANFHADYRISAANIPEEVSGKLDFVFNAEEPPEFQNGK